MKRKRHVAAQSRRPTHLEATFAGLWKMLAHGQPEPVTEYRFHPSRRWRFDFAWPKLRLAVEIEGGLYHGRGGGHVSVNGFIGDCEKYNAATLLGWRVLRYTERCLRQRPVQVIGEVAAACGCPQNN